MARRDWMLRVLLPGCGLIVLGVVPGYLFGAILRPDSKLEPAVIALLGSLVGAGSSYLGMLYTTSRADARHRAENHERALSVARAIAGEINFLGVQVTGRARTILKWREMGSKAIQAKYWSTLFIPEPGLYPALKTQIGHLPAVLAEKVVGFYSALLETNLAHARTTELTATSDVPESTVETYLNFLRHTELAAAAVVTALRQFVGDDTRIGLRGLIDVVGPSEPGRTPDAKT